MTFVHETYRGDGLGSTVLTAFEEEAKQRGCTHVFVTSFTFQAPAFYQRHGYRDVPMEIGPHPGTRRRSHA
jgi:GNAT superfamily N-acetyltransferase